MNKRGNSCPISFNRRGMKIICVVLLGNKEAFYLIVSGIVNQEFA